MTSPNRWGPDFSISLAISVAELALPSVTALENGNIVVTWCILHQSGYNGIWARVLNTAGEPIGSEFLINTSTNPHGSLPAIASLSNGGFVVTWTDDSGIGGDAHLTAIKSQIYNALGAPQGEEFLVNTTTAGAQFDPAITALSNGGFVVSWSNGENVWGGASSVRAQLFNSEGLPQGDEFMVNAPTFGGKFDAAITALSNGGFVVTWTDNNPNGGDRWSPSIEAQIYNALGERQGVHFRVNTTTFLKQSEPDITALANGGFVITWQDYSSQSDNIRAQVYNAEGIPQSVEFIVNTTLRDNQYYPAISALANGGFVVAWTSYEGDTGPITAGNIIRAQVFTADGVPQGAEFVASSPIGYMSHPDITALEDGRFLIVWQNYTTDYYAETSIEGQIFDLRVNAETVHGTLVDDVYAGTIFADQIAGSEGNDTLWGAAGDDALFGDAGNDSLMGGDDNDTIMGGAGNDTLTGGDGNDTLIGGTGNDLYVVNSGVDIVIESAGSDRDTVQTSITYTLTANVESLTLTGSASINGTGNSTDNVIIGNPATNVLTGGAGNDTLDGGAGNDTLVGGAGNDAYVTDGGDTITESSGSGTDTVQSSATATLGANLENLTLTGSSAINGMGNTLNNTMTGNSSANTLNGGAGVDTLIGGMGRDLLTGAAGNDTFIFKNLVESGITATTSDVITDFVRGQDKIDLSSIDAFASSGANDTFVWKGTAAFSSATQGEVRYQKFDNTGSTNDYTMVWIDNDRDTGVEMAIRLTGLYNLSASDFIL